MTDDAIYKIGTPVKVGKDTYYVIARYDQPMFLIRPGRMFLAKSDFTSMLEHVTKLLNDGHKP